MKKTTFIIISCLLTSFAVTSQEANAPTMNQETNLANHPSNIENKNLTQNLDQTISEKNQGKISAGINIPYSNLHGDFDQDTSKDNIENIGLPADISKNNSQQIIEDHKVTREECDIPDEDDLEDLPADREQDFTRFVEKYDKKYQESTMKVLANSQYEPGYNDAKWTDVFRKESLTKRGIPFSTTNKNDLLPNAKLALAYFGKRQAVQVQNGFIQFYRDYLIFRVYSTRSWYNLVIRSPNTVFKVIKKFDNEAGYVEAKWKDIFKKHRLNNDGTPKLNNQIIDLETMAIPALYLFGQKEIIQVENGYVSYYHGNFIYKMYGSRAEYKLVMSSPTLTELDIRKRRFWRSLKRVECFNKLGLSWKKDINKYSDLTIEEKKSLFASGAVQFNHNNGRKRMLQRNTDSSYSDQKNTNSILDSKINWNEKSAVTPVGTQWMCANSWAYAAVGAIEGAYFNKTNTQKEFSVVQMSQCTDSNTVCQGGIPTNAYLHAFFHGVQLKNYNSVFELSKPEFIYYKDVQNPASQKYVEANLIKEKDISFTTPKADSQICQNQEENKFEKLSLTNFKKIRHKDNNELKAAVANQPVSVGIVGSDLLEYSYGIIDRNSCKTNLIDHSVLIVGYDSSFNGKDYWIVKNSWGSGWGDKGYMYIERQEGQNEGTCGIALEATYPIVDVVN